jgi:hypothetical protein
MPIDHPAAESFIWTAARLVDRHRYALWFKDGRVEPIIDALRGYRNPDGGFGHALEPDLRCPASQPAPTLSPMAASRSCCPVLSSTRTRRGSSRSRDRS